MISVNPRKRTQESTDNISFDSQNRSDVIDQEIKSGTDLAQLPGFPIKPII